MGSLHIEVKRLRNSDGLDLPAYATSFSAGMDLLAVGGYGRAELHPHSDVDIGILLQAEVSDQQTMDLSAWVTQLWDLGLDIGHSVRTVDDCEREAANDVTVITNLMVMYRKLLH